MGVCDGTRIIRMSDDRVADREILDNCECVVARFDSRRLEIQEGVMVVWNEQKELTQ